MHRNTRAALALMAVSVALGYLSQRPTEATPAFAKKEGNIPCGYCHVKASGGGRRNYRGKFYGAHDQSFAGFDDAAEAKAAGVEIAPFADTKPLSLTPPAGAPAAAPVAPPVAPPAAPVAPPAAAKSPVAMASDKAHAAKLAYDKTPTNATAKKNYITALAALTHATLMDTSIPNPKRDTDTQALAKRVLALDPKNASALADLKAAKAGK